MGLRPRQITESNDQYDERPSEKINDQFGSMEEMRLIPFKLMKAFNSHSVFFGAGGELG